MVSRKLQALPSTRGRVSTNLRVGHEGTLEWLPVSRLHVNRAYQRAVNQTRVHELAKTWDDSAFGILLVARTDNGDYLLDGQHRKEALIALGLEGHEAPCFVMHDLTLQEQADVFWRINKTRLQPGSADTFRARLVAGEQNAIGLNEAATKHGVTIMYHPAALGPNELFAIAAAERIFEAGDLDWVFGTIRLGWHDVPSALRQDRILGMWRFYQVFRQEFSGNTELANARYQHLLQRMEEFSPTAVVEKAIEFKQTLHSRPSNAFARALHYYFNYRIKTSNVRLHTWPVLSPSDTQ